MCDVPACSPWIGCGCVCHLLHQHQRKKAMLEKKKALAAKKVVVSPGGAATTSGTKKAAKGTKLSVADKLKLRSQKFAKKRAKASGSKEQHTAMCLATLAHACAHTPPKHTPSTHSQATKHCRIVSFFCRLCGTCRGRGWRRRLCVGTCASTCSSGSRACPSPSPSPCRSS